jgi:hypothetical protein
MVVSTVEAASIGAAGAIGRLTESQNGSTANQAWAKNSRK